MGSKRKRQATIFSVTTVLVYQKKLGRKSRVIKVLMELARTESISLKRDTLVAILNLVGNRETVEKLLEVGVVEMASEVMDRLQRKV